MSVEFIHLRFLANILIESANSTNNSVIGIESATLQKLIETVKNKQVIYDYLNDNKPVLMPREYLVLSSREDPISLRITAVPASTPAPASIPAPDSTPAPDSATMVPPANNADDGGFVDSSQEDELRDFIAKSEAEIRFVESKLLKIQTVRAIDETYNLAESFRKARGLRQERIKRVIEDRRVAESDNASQTVAEKYALDIQKARLIDMIREFK